MEPYVLSLFLGLLTFCLSLLLRHRLTLWRDKRKEFNEVATALREVLLKERNTQSPMLGGIDEIAADRLAAAMPFWRRRAFTRAWKAYRDSKKNTCQDALGQAFYIDPGDVVARIDKLLRFTERR